MHALRAPLLDSPPLGRYGYPEVKAGPQPAAGAHFTQPITGEFLTRLVSVFVRLVTSAAVANREVVVEYRTTEGSRYALAGSAVVQAASLTVDYFFSAYQPEVRQPVDTSQLVPLSPILLRPTDDFRIFVVNVQAADQLSRIRFVWERFYSRGEPPGE